MLENVTLGEQLRVRNRVHHEFVCGERGRD